MAKLHALTVQEGVNASGPGGQWTVNGVSTIHAGTGPTHTVHLDVSGAAQLGIYAAKSIYFRFGILGTTGTADDCVAADDLVIPANTLIFITVPRGLGKTIYFNHLGIAVTTVKIVEI
tara:strand:+ start:2873 stop:3226 length:354 start_codon:yes stop_codon:yes gene_type:complete